MAVLFFSCNNNNPNKEKLSGKCYYGDYPLSHIESEGTAYTEYLGEMNSKVIYTMHWEDSMHYELEVTQVEGTADAMYKPGDAIEVEVNEITPSYFRFFAKGYYIFVLRQRAITALQVRRADKTTAMLIVTIDGLYVSRAIVLSMHSKRH